jgi:type II secretion system protein D
MRLSKSFLLHRMIRHFYILTIFLITSLPLFSQNPEVPAIPGVPPVGNETLIKEKIESTDFNGNDLAGLYTKYTDRRVIVSSAAAKASFALNLDASPKAPLTYAQAAEILKKTATIEGFIFVPDATDPKLDFLTLASGGIRPTNIGIPVFTENNPLPQGDAVITYFMKLDHIKPDEAVRTFTQIIGQFGAYGSIAASSNAAAVIITENTSLIRKLIDIKAQIDKPSSLVATRFINVKFADVTELATTLNEMLGTQQQTTRTAGIQRAPQPNIANDSTPNAGLADSASGGSSGEETPIQIIPDPRTNRIVAIGRPVDLLFVEGLISQFDIQSDQRNFLRRKLEFLAVADFLPIAGDALTRAFSGTGTGGTTNGQSQPGNGGGLGGSSNRQQTNNSSNNNNRNSSNSGLGGLGGSGGGGSSGGSSKGDALSDPNINSAPVSLLVGRTLLVADNITNSIIVQGPPSSVEIIEKLLDQVDVKADQVMISTFFGQLSLGDSTSTGVDWLRAFRGNEDGGIGFSNLGGKGATGSDPTGLLDPITGTVAGTFPNQSGLSLYGKIGNSLAAYINLLSTSNDFTVLSRPSIFTANNRKGTISSGKRVAIPTNSNSFTGGGVSTNVEYRDVVLKLEVIPLINSEKEITLQIALVSDSIGKDTPIEGLGNIPEINTRELLTTVTVPNNQTIVLGGLITSNDTESVTGIPILSDIPGLGRLFSTKTKGVDRDELMIFIQPSIVNSDKSLKNVKLNMDSRYDVSDPARNFAGDTLLPSLETPIASPQDSKTPEKPEAKKQKPMRPIHKR